jgi:hypothetical protein
MNIQDAIQKWGRPIPFVFKLITETATYVLDNSPSKWDGSLWNTTRNRESLAVVRSFSDELVFSGVDRERIMSVPLSGNLNQDVFIEIWKLNRTTVDYELYYKGRVNYTDVQDDTIECKIKLIDIDVFAHLDRNSSVDYEMLATPSFLNYTDIGDWYSNRAIQVPSNYEHGPSPTSNSLIVLRPFIEFENPQGGIQNQDAGIRQPLSGIQKHRVFGGFDFEPFYRTDLGFFNSVAGTNQIQLNVRHILQKLQGVPVTYALENESLMTYIPLHHHTPTTNNAHVVHINVTKDFNSPYAQLWKLVYIYSAPLLSNQLVRIFGFSGEIAVNKFRKSSIVPCIPIPNMAVNLLRGMTDNEFSTVEGLSDLSKKVVLSGNCLKGLSSYGNLDLRFPIKTNWDAFTKHLRNVHGYTYRVEGDKIVFTNEPFKDEIWTDLGEVGTFKQTIMKDFLYKRVRAGFGQIESNDKYIFDLQREKTFDLEKFKIIDANELDLNSEINCSVYAINEKFRERYDNDREIAEDNDLFMIDAEYGFGGALYPIYNQNSFIKIGAKNFFNLDYTAMRILQRHSAMLQILNPDLELHYKNQNTDSDVDFINEEFGQITYEDENINQAFPIIKHPQRIEPIIYEVELSEREINFKELLENSDKIITFTYRNENYAGYFDDFGESSWSQETKTLRLIKAKI